MAAGAVRLKDFDKCCRCCLLALGQMKPIFAGFLNTMFEDVLGLQACYKHLRMSEKLPTARKKPQLRRAGKKFKPRTNDISKYDRLPQQMCSRCILKLSSAHTFVLSVKKNQKTLALVLKEADMQNDPEESSIQIEVEGYDESVLKVESIMKVELPEYITEEISISSDIQTENLSVKSDLSEEVPNSEDIHHCVQCDYNALSQEDLQVHLQKHLSSRKDTEHREECAHMCSLCGKRFRWRTSLAKHARAHRAALACRVCDKRYQEAAALRAHLVSHSLVNPKPYACHCGARFGQRSALRRHARARHDAVRRRCPDCGASFASTHSLKKHCARDHIVTQCNECLQYFMGKKNLNIHLKTHEEQPSNISNKSVKGETLATDIETVTVEFLCLLCGTRFQRREGLEVHSCSNDCVT